MKKRLITLLLVCVMIIGVIPLSASAASYPLMMVDFSETSQTIPQGDTGYIVLTIFPEYKNENYYVDIYNSNGVKIASADWEVYNYNVFTRTWTVSVDTAYLDMGVGEYTVKYYSEFYSLSEWHKSPRESTYKFKVVSNVCNGNHNFEISYVYSQSTCTENGEIEKTCINCGHEIREELPLGDHSYIETITKNATCVEEGTLEKVCSVCNDTIYESVPMIEHNYIETIISTPTCTIDGQKEKKCDYCGDIVSEPIAALGHKYSNPIDNGNGTETKTCTICGDKVTNKIVHTTPMYRMYNPNSGEHFYTGSTEERDILVNAGWHYEGVAFNFPVVGKPVYRLYEPKTGEHLYTMDENEKAKLLSEGWNYEGVAFNSAGEDEVAQYRLHNPNATCGAYHFTGSKEERDILINAGWEYQGIGWYSCLR